MTLALAAAPAATQLTHPKYRPDIDGLRAIAVLSVVGFHAFPVVLSGGFIGVDIFFVISGYLISSIIFENLQHSSFSFITFYSRRIRRIFPALLIVLVASYVFGWFVLLADEYRALGRHIAGGAGFISNFLLWRESGYFDTAAETKPMLHLWSLGIEEQFYIVWPLTLALAWKRHSSLLTITVVIAVVSFAANVYLVGGNPTAAFYSPVSRFWELMIGGVLAHVVLHRPQLNRAYKNAQSILGFALLALGLVCINEARAFPGWLALLPTLGCFLIISAGPAAWLNRFVLSNRILVWFGVISYPLYLWHWPLLSFARIVVGSAPSQELTLAAVASAIALAWLTYRLVEQPIRRGGGGAAKATALACLMGAVFAGGVLGYAQKLRPSYSNPVLQSVISGPNEWEYLASLNKGKLAGDGFYYVRTANPSTTVFIGDSHVAQYGPRIGRVLGDHAAAANTVIFAIDGGCMPIPGVLEDAPIHRRCDAIRGKAFDLIRQSSVKVVVIGAAWNLYFIQQAVYPKVTATDFDYYFLNGAHKEYFRNGKGGDLAIDELEKMLASIGREKKVYMLLDNPFGAGFDPHIFFNRNRFSTGAAVTASPTTGMDPAQQNLRERLIDVAGRAGIEVIDPVPAFCNEGTCNRLMPDGRPLYKDNSHLSSFWIERHASFIDKAVITR